MPPRWRDTSQCLDNNEKPRRISPACEKQLFVYVFTHVLLVFIRIFYDDGVCISSNKRLVCMYVRTVCLKKVHPLIFDNDFGQVCTDYQNSLTN